MTDRLQSFSAWASSSASLHELPRPLAADLRRSITAGRKAGASLVVSGSPEIVFRAAVAEAITSLAHQHRLLIDFLVKGPYYDSGEIPEDKRADHITDAECARAIRFVFGGVVNAFKGRLAELLAIGPCAELVERLAAKRRVPRGTRLLVGDVVRVRGLTGDALRKGADIHFAAMSAEKTVIQGVVEVKSFSPSTEKVRAQLERHVRRLRRGFAVSKAGPAQGSVVESPVRVWAVPASWKLPRSFELRPKSGGGSTLVYDESLAVTEVEPTEVDGGFWRIKLGWSEEALAAAAHELSFWYMEKLGEHVFTKEPSPWPEMTPAEAGKNAAKQSLYYAIRRLGDRDQVRQRAGLRNPDEQKAIALYNSYGLGYALGSNFKDPNGRREMLWPEDLRAIAANGVTKNGSRIT